MKIIYLFIILSIFACTNNSDYYTKKQCSVCKGCGVVPASTSDKIVNGIITFGLGIPKEVQCHRCKGRGYEICTKIYLQ